MEQDMDYDEMACIARAERRRILAHLRPEPQHPIPKNFGRQDSVWLLRLVTGTAVTPAVLASWGLLRPSENSPHPGICPRCHQHYATSQHLIWDCTASYRERTAALTTILPPGHRPTTYEEWIHPPGPPQRQSKVYEALLTFLHQSDLGSYI